MKKVLIITYFFPPDPSVASLRLQGLAKYLPQFGWEPIILTPRLPNRQPGQIKVIETDYPGDVTMRIKKSIGLNPEKTLEHGLGIPSNVRETNQRWLINILGFFYGIVTYPEEQRGWYQPGLQQGINFLNLDKVDCILSSSGPSASHKIASKLKERFSVPWVADYRDLWSQWHNYLYGPVFNLFDRIKEKNTIASADAITSVSQPLIENLRNIHTKTPGYSIPNGYDPELINAEQDPLSKAFSITYTGHIYPSKQDPTPLIKAISNLISQNKISPDKIQVTFLGLGKKYFLQESIKRYGLENIVVLGGTVSRDESLKIQRQSQLLLLLNWINPKELGVYTGKVFEYLAAKRPILAIGGSNESVISQLLNETKAGDHINDPCELEKFLLNAYQEYLNNGSVAYHGISDKITKYTHVEMARKFADVFNAVSEN